MIFTGELLNVGFPLLVLEPTKLVGIGYDIIPIGSVCMVYMVSDLPSTKNPVLLAFNPIALNHPF